MTLLNLYLFAFIILVHGLVHLLCYARTFLYAQQAKSIGLISKGDRVFWLITGCCFAAVLIVYLLKNDAWWVFGLVAIIISQILIIRDWKDAKFGTFLNVFILLVSTIGIANWSFSRMVKKEVKQLLTVPVQQKIITNDMISDLPIAVQRWLINAGAIGKPNIYNVEIKQKGFLRTKPSGKWMDFNAKEYFTIEKPAFNWQVKVNMMPLLFMNGRDKFVDGKGEMLIQFLSLKSVADAKPSTQVNEGSAIRYLSEICWFPTAALSSYIKWDPINDSTAGATLTYNNTSASGIFYFTKSGDVKAFEAMRYGEFKGKMSLEKWHIETKAFKSFDGLRIPSYCEVTWKLDEADFTWLRLQLDTVVYNSRDFNKVE